MEELFGILRTMVGNDANVDMLQLVSRLSGTMEVANILVKYPHWYDCPSGEIWRHWGKGNRDGYK